jgi:hypothetical protein
MSKKKGGEHQDTDQHATDPKSIHTTRCVNQAFPGRRFPRVHAVGNPFPIMIEHHTRRLEMSRLDILLGQIFEPMKLGRHRKPGRFVQVQFCHVGLGGTDVEMAPTDGLRAIYGEVSRDGKVTLTIEKIDHFGGRGYERYGHVVGLTPQGRCADDIFRVTVKRVRAVSCMEGVRE